MKIIWVNGYEESDLTYNNRIVVKLDSVGRAWLESLQLGGGSYSLNTEMGFPAAYAFGKL